MTSCLDYEVLEPAQRVTALSGAIRVEQGDTSLLRGDFALDPGTDEAGRTHDRPTDALLLENVPLPPSNSPGNLLIYRGVLPLPAVVLERLAVNLTVPAVPGANAAQFELSLPIIVRPDSGAITLRRGTDLVIRTRRAPNLNLQAPFSWQLEIAVTCSGGVRFASLEVLGVIPDSVIMPWSVMGSAVPAKFQACLRVFSQSISNAGNYRYAITVDHRLGWKVEVVD